MHEVSYGVGIGHSMINRTLVEQNSTLIEQEGTLHARVQLYWYNRKLIESRNRPKIKRE